MHLTCREHCLKSEDGVLVDLFGVDAKSFDFFGLGWISSFLGLFELLEGFLDQHALLQGVERLHNVV